MTKNLILIIAKELGVEIGEEFKLRDKKGTFAKTFSDEKEAVFRFTENGVMVVMDDEEKHTTRPLLEDIVCGELEVVKLPYEPKYGEKYWTYEGENFGVADVPWYGEAGDYCIKACGCIFRTREEALKARIDR